MEAKTDKHVVSVSLGASSRDHRVVHELLGQTFTIERRGTDGDFQTAIQLIKALDGKVDAIGMGGIDLFVVAGKRRYVLRDARRLAQAARISPIVDGSGLKNTLERRVIRRLQQQGLLDVRGRRVLLVSAVDRFGMAEALAEAGAELLIGDLLFLLKVPVVLRSLKQLDWVARLFGPIAASLPISMLYPTGKKQESVTPRHAHLYQAADIIAGDFHLIRRYMPPQLEGKIIITNTITAADRELLAAAGVKRLITTTPELAGRSFATNVLEAVLIAASGRTPAELTPADYEAWLDRLAIEPTVRDL